MTNSKESATAFSELITRIVQGDGLLAHQPQDLVGRRQFIVGAAMGTAGLALPSLVHARHPAAVKFNWELLIGIARTVAQVMGYGPIADTVLQLLRCKGDILSNFTAIEQRGFISPCRLPPDAPNIVQGEVANAQPGVQPTPNASATAPSPSPSKTERFLTAAPHNDRYNGLGLFYDLGFSQDPTGQLSLPTLNYFQKMAQRLRTLGYSTKADLRGAITPQTQSRAALGRFHEKYSEPDKYVGRGKGEFEFFYETAGNGSGTFHAGGRLENKSTGRIVTFNDRIPVRYEANLVK